MATSPASAASVRNRIAAFSTQTNQLVGSFSPNIGYHVHDIAVTENTVYVGGNFLNVGSVYRGRLAAFDATNGALLSWAPDASDRQVLAIEVSPDRTQVAVAGHFETLNGTSTFGRGFAVVDAVSGAVVPFAATERLRNGGVDGAITSLDSDGGVLYVTGYTYGRTTGTLEGTAAARWGDGAIEWVNDCHGDTYAVHAQGAAVYAVGHAHYCGNIDGFGQGNPWDFYRGLAMTREAAGTVRTERLGYADFAGLPRPDLLNFFPSINAGTVTGLRQGPWHVTGDDRYIVMGGEFTRVNGTAQQGLVRFATSDVAPNDQGPFLFNETYPIKVRSFDEGSVTISWSGNRDRDDATLRYRVYRRTGGEGNGDLVHSRTVTAPFWDLPVMTYTDDTASGSGYEYRVQVDDGDDNFANSPWTTVAQADPASDYLRAVLETEPDSLWRLGESAGSTVATDLVGWRDAAISTIGVTLDRPGAIAGDTDTAAEFAGTNSAHTVVTTTPEHPSHVFSLEAWVRTAANANGGLIVGFNSSRAGDGNTSAHDRALYMDTAGRLRFAVNPTTPVAIGSEQDFRDNQWHHVVGTLGADGMTLYVDGVPVAQRDDIVDARTGYYGFVRIGGGALNGFPGTNTSTGRRFDGFIDDVAFYKKALTRQRVVAHFEAAGGQTVNEAPSAAFTASPDGLSVAVDAAPSVDLDGAITGWAWNFGDGTTSVEGPATSHTYTADGTYTITLTVTDDDGATSAVASEEVTVAAPPNAAPLAAFDAVADGLSVAVDAGSSADADGVVSGWAWDFGDGTTSVEGPVTNHVYAAAGTYTVSLVVTDDDGAVSDAASVEVTAEVPPLVSELALDGFERVLAAGWGAADVGGDWSTTSSAANYSVTDGAGTIRMTGPGSGRSAYLEGVSSSSSDVSVQVTLDKPATGGGTYVSVVGRRVSAAADYRVKLRYLPNGSVQAFLEHSAGGQSVLAASAPIPGLTVAAGEALNVRFQAEGTSPTSLRAKVWKATDAQPAGWLLTATDDTAALQVPGGVGLVTYLSGSATNAPQVTSFDNFAVIDPNVGPPPPNVVPSAAFSASSDGLSVTVDAGSSSDVDGLVSGWTWDFGDGTTSVDGPVTSHAYATAGTYTITLTVADDDGELSSAVSQEVMVQDAPLPGGPLASDEFARVLTAGWGAADVGGLWSTTGPAANYAVVDGVGTMLMASPGVGRAGYLDGVSSSSSDVSVQVTLDKPATGGGTYVSLVGRRVTSPSVADYRLKLRYLSNGSVQAFLVRFSGGGQTNLATLAPVPGLTVGAGETLNVRLQVDGTGSTTLRAKVWKADAAQPAAWALTATDDTAVLQAPGGVGVITYLSGSATNAPQTASFDNLDAVIVE